LHSGLPKEEYCRYHDRHFRHVGGGIAEGPSENAKVSEPVALSVRRQDLLDLVELLGLK